MSKQSTGSMEYQLIETDWQTHESQLRSIRTAVFVEELAIPAEIEFDAEDEVAQHFLLLNNQQQAVGCARMLATGQLGRLAVLAEKRNATLGSRLVKAVLNYALEQGMQRVFLHAQVAARDFYERNDFRAYGDEFESAGIKHISMEMPLPIAFVPSTATQAEGSAGANSEASKPSNNVHLLSRNTPAQTPETSQGSVSKLREFFNETDALSGLLQVMHGANRSIKLYSPYLDHDLFDTPDFVSMASDFVRSAPSCRVEILIAHSHAIVTRGHTLLELVRRLDGKMSIRNVPDGLSADAQSWLIADSHGVWVQSEADDYRGWSDTFNPLQAERFAKRFTHFWDRSVNDPELRLLRI